MNKKIRILNGYAGLGGNAKNWDIEKFEITAVEKNEKIADVYKQNNPGHKIIVGDIIKHLLEFHQDYDIIWLSPPCQTHTKMVKATRHKLKKLPDMTLYQVIIFLTHFFKGFWVVENVKPYYDFLIEPTVILGRHVFWSNFDISFFDVKRPKGFINKSNTKGANELKKWLGINYKGNIYYEGNHCPAQVLRNCVHPKMGEHILNEIYSKKLLNF